MFFSQAPNALDFGNSWDSCGDTVEVVNPCDTDATKKAQADNACNILRDSVGKIHSLMTFRLILQFRLAYVCLCSCYCLEIQRTPAL